MVKLEFAAGTVGLGQLAVAGSKVQANASKRIAMRYDRMQAAEKRVEAEIETITKPAAEQAAAELSNREARLAVIQKPMKKFGERKATEEDQQTQQREDQARAAGKAPPKKHSKSSVGCARYRSDLNPSRE